MIGFASCKINIGLDVVARRADGYHDLQTMMLPVTGLCDAVELLEADESSLEVYGVALDCPPEKNLCMKALRLMQERFGAGEARICLQKAVPSGAGLGGGSADAAAVVTACNAFFSLGLNDAQMEEAAATLGSDVPFFIRNRPAMASGRGEVLSPAPAGVLARLAGKHLLIVKPPVAVSTAEAYAGIHPVRPAEPLAERLGRDMQSWHWSVFNAFERHVFAAHPILSVLKETLYAMGATYASMSGSGSALYGIFDRAPEADLFPEEIFVYQQVISPQDK